MAEIKYCVECGTEFKGKMFEVIVSGKPRCLCVSCYIKIQSRASDNLGFISHAASGGFVSHAAWVQYGMEINPKPIHKRGQCLEKAQKTINGKRQTTHGAPEDSFGTIARYWEVYLNSVGFDVSLKKSDITTMMSLFKHARMSGQGYTEDNYTDAAGYIGLAADFRAEEEK